jgi:hypothetical protein
MDVDVKATEAVVDIILSPATIASRDAAVRSAVRLAERAGWCRCAARRSDIQVSLRKAIGPVDQHEANPTRATVVAQGWVVLGACDVLPSNSGG